MVALFSALALLVSDPCWLHGACNTTAWDLDLNGFTLGTFETEAECKEVFDEIYPQTPPFTELVCVEIKAAREEA